MAQLNEPSGVITSPFYPRRYPNNQDCTWQITANKGNRVKLEIEDTLDIFQCLEICLCDYLEVQNGFSSDGALSGRTCGRPGRILTFYSILETLTVRFFSDGANEMQSVGFKATYTHLNFTPPGKCTSSIWVLGFSIKQPVNRLISKATNMANRASQEDLVKPRLLQELLGF